MGGKPQAWLVVLDSRCVHDQTFSPRPRARVFVREVGVSWGCPVSPRARREGTKFWCAVPHTGDWRSAACWTGPTVSKNESSHGRQSDCWIALQLGRFEKRSLGQHSFQIPVCCFQISASRLWVVSSLSHPPDCCFADKPWDFCPSLCIFNNVLILLNNSRFHEFRAAGVRIRQFASPQRLTSRPTDSGFFLWPPSTPVMWSVICILSPCFRLYSVH